MRTKLNLERLEGKQMLSATTADVDYTTDDAAVWADGESPIMSTTGHEGWTYSNTAGKKINWYFYSQNLTNNSLNRLGDIENITGTFKDMPSSGPTGTYFTVYTAPQNDGHDASSWYRSRINYVGNYSQIGTGQVTISYDDAGVPVPSSPSFVPLHVDLFSSRGPQQSTEVLMTIALSTASGQAAASEQFTLSTIDLGLTGSDTHYTFTTLGGQQGNSELVVDNIALDKYAISRNPTSPLPLYYSSIVTSSPVGGLLTKIDGVTGESVNMIQPATTSNLSAILNLLQARVIRPTDLVVWTPPEGSSGRTTIFDYKEWNTIENTALATEELFAELGTS
jgi:hypothetical protein